MDVGGIGQRRVVGMGAGLAVLRRVEHRRSRLGLRRLRKRRVSDTQRSRFRHGRKRCISGGTRSSYRYKSKSSASFENCTYTEAVGMAEDTEVRYNTPRVGVGAEPRDRGISAVKTVV